jgi:elongation factor G
MKTFSTSQIKNLVIVGNSGSGKTTLSEALLFEGGVIERRGDVESKNTVSDFKEIEQNNSSSVFSSLLYTIFNDNKINLIDVPGLDDFVNGIVSALPVTDSALMVVNAQNGIEVGAEIHGRYLANANKVIMFVVNQLDHEKANWDKALESIKERFGNHAVVIQYPLNTGAGFDSIIDVLAMKLYKYPKEGGKPQILDIPADQKDQADELHAALVERAAESDEALMEQFFANDSLTPEELQKGIKAGLLQRGIFPIFCVSAKRNIGVGRLLEFVSQLAPAPNDVPAPVAGTKEVKCNPSGPATLFVYKSAVETHIGEINYFKVMAGEVKEGMDLFNNTTQNKERLAQLFVVAGKIRTKVPGMMAGDLGATVKLKATKTNHTLSADNNLIFKSIEFPEPKFRIAIRSLSEGDEEKLGEALQRMNFEDPTIRIEYSKELKQIILSGQGEYHMNILKWHLDNIFKLGTEFVTPKIPYRETITKYAYADYRHKKQSGGAGQFGEVHMVIEPHKEGMPDTEMFKIEGKDQKMSLRDKEEIELAWGGKLVYFNCIVGGSIDARFLPAILKGIMEKIETGPLTGSYARDIRVYVYDGKMHPVDSNEISFKLAGRNAFSLAFKKAAPKILEPMYLVDVLVPGDRMGDVMSDLQGRRAIVQGMSTEMGFQKITAKVPLAEMNKYSTALSSITGGRAVYSMKFLDYEPVPGNVQEDLLKAYEAEDKDE